jgi:hypothetical protein
MGKIRISSLHEAALIKQGTSSSLFLSVKFDELLTKFNFSREHAEPKNESFVGCKQIHRKAFNWQSGHFVPSIGCYVVSFAGVKIAFRTASTSDINEVAEVANTECLSALFHATLLLKFPGFYI